MDSSSIQNKIIEMGFKHVYEWRDSPHATYEAHAHKGRVILYIQNGGLTLKFDDQTITLKIGDYYEVPPGKTHTAEVGAEGCDYIVGEMVEGDS